MSAKVGKPARSGRTERLERYRRGRLSELLAAAMLLAKGYRILERRCRTPYGELDIVAVRARRIAFVEVKRRPTRAEAEAALTDPQSADATIFWSLRLPRALLAALIGAALASSGCALQGLLRNPLADPFVLGVSGGAALGATLSLALGFGTVGELVGTGLGEGVSRMSGPAIFAFLGSLGATALVFAAGQVRGRTTPYAALLTGVIFNAFIIVLAVTTLDRYSDETPSRQETRRRMTGFDRLG